MIELPGRNRGAGAARSEIIGPHGFVLLMENHVPPAAPTALMASHWLFVGHALPQAFHHVTQPRWIHPR